MSAVPSDNVDRVWQLEEGTEILIDFVRFRTKSAMGIIPVAVQDIETKEVLLVGFANESALTKSVNSGVAHFWSYTRDQLWAKGDTSGNYLDLKEVRINCEQNSLLFLVSRRNGGACHTKNARDEYRRGCFYRRISGKALERV